MIKTSKFYSNRVTPIPRCTTLIEAQDQATSHRSRNIVILPIALHLLLTIKKVTLQMFQNSL